MKFYSASAVFDFLVNVIKYGMKGYDITIMKNFSITWLCKLWFFKCIPAFQILQTIYSLKELKYYDSIF